MPDPVLRTRRIWLGLHTVPFLVLLLVAGEGARTDNCPAPVGLNGDHGPFAHGSASALVDLGGWLLVLYALAAVGLAIASLRTDRATVPTRLQTILNAPLMVLWLLWNIVLYIGLEDSPVFCDAGDWGGFAVFIAPPLLTTIVINRPWSRARRRVPFRRGELSSDGAGSGR